MLTVGKCKTLLKESDLDLSQSFVAVDCCDFQIIFDFEVGCEAQLTLVPDLPPSDCPADYFLEYISSFSEHVIIRLESGDEVRLLRERFSDGAFRFNLVSEVA